MGRLGPTESQGRRVRAESRDATPSIASPPRRRGRRSKGRRRSDPREFSWRTWRRRSAQGKHAGKRDTARIEEYRALSRKDWRRLQWALNPQSELPAKTPVDAAARRHDAGNVFAELHLERRRPGHKLEAEPVVDHGETAGSEAQSLAVGSGDIRAFGFGPVRRLRFSRKLGAYRVEFPSAKCPEKIARKDDTLALPLREARRGKMINPGRERLAHLLAEAGMGEGVSVRSTRRRSSQVAPSALT